MRALTNALDTGRVHHAFLFTGTRGVGKTTIARIFAKSLNCERGTSAPSRAASARPACDIDAGRFVDLLEIDAASNTGVDDVRELIENAQYMPSRGRVQGLPDRRSAHAVEDGVQRAAEDAGGAAGAREVPARHHRSAEAAGHGAVALPAVQPQAAGRGADQRPDHARSSRPRASPPSPARSASSRAPPTAACATACRCSTRPSPTPAAASSTTRRVARDARHGRSHAGRRPAGRAGRRRRRAHCCDDRRHAGRLLARLGRRAGRPRRCAASRAGAPAGARRGRSTTTASTSMRSPRSCGRNWCSSGTRWR